MKERVREAVFNLVGPAAKGKLVLDLFSGTGAMALESISRGAKQAIAVERRFPNAKTISRNAQQLGVNDLITVVPADTFTWLPRTSIATSQPWLVFCCPPYDFYVTRTDQMVQLIQQLIARGPSESIIVVECDERFDTDLLQDADRWDTRVYSPAVVSLRTMA